MVAYDHAYGVMDATCHGANAVFGCLLIFLVCFFVVSVLGSRREKDIQLSKGKKV